MIDDDDDPVWTLEKIEILLRGFGGSIRGKKGGKILPTEKLLDYIREALEVSRPSGSDD